MTGWAILIVAGMFFAGVGLGVVFTLLSWPELDR